MANNMTKAGQNGKGKQMDSQKLVFFIFFVTCKSTWQFGFIFCNTI